MNNNEMAQELRHTIEESHPFRLLLVAADVHETDALLPLAQAIVSERNGQLIVMHIVTLPDAESLSEGAAHARESREALDAFLQAAVGPHPDVRTVVRVARELWSDIWSTVEQEQIDLLLLGWRNDALAETAAVDLSHPRLAAPPCDVIAVRLGAEMAGSEWWRQVRRILLPLRGGQSSSLALNVANLMASAANATVTVLHATERDAPAQEVSVFAALSTAWRGLPRFMRSIIKFGDVPGAILEEAVGYDVVVMGAPKWPAIVSDWSGPVVKAVASDIRACLITVKERVGMTSRYLGTSLVSSRSTLKCRRSRRCHTWWTSGLPRTRSTAKSSRTSTVSSP